MTGCTDISQRCFIRLNQYFLIWICLQSHSWWFTFNCSSCKPVFPSAYQQWRCYTINYPFTNIIASALTTLCPQYILKHCLFDCQIRFPVSECSFRSLIFYQFSQIEDGQFHPDDASWAAFSQWLKSNKEVWPSYFKWGWGGKSTPVLALMSSNSMIAQDNGSISKLLWLPSRVRLL